MIRACIVSIVVAVAAPAAGAQDSAAKRGEFRGAMQTEYPAWFKESFLELRDDVREATARSKRLLVIFHQDGCPYCNQLVERNFAQKDIEQHVREHFDAVALNMWGDREVASIDGKTYTEKTFAAALRVQYTPTLLFMDEQGKTVLRLNGYLPPRSFKLALEYVSGRHETKTTYRQFVAENAPPATDGDLREQSFFAKPPYILTRSAAGGAKPLAVFFEQKDCPSCATLHDTVLSEPATRELLARFDSVQLDMWSDTPVLTPDSRRTTAREWARALEVAYAPTIVYFDATGKEVIRAEAWFKRFHNQSIMDYVLSGAYHEEPSFQRYISERADALRERGIDVDLWK